MNVLFGAVLPILIPILWEDAITRLMYKTRFFQRSVTDVEIILTGLGENNF
jgi:hypothetical protein